MIATLSASPCICEITFFGEEATTDWFCRRRGAFADSGGGRSAFVLGDDGLAQRRQVRLGARSAGEIEVLDGLAAGEHVIISSIAEFEDYDTIQVVD